MTISGPAVKSQVKGHDEVMEPYRLAGPSIQGRSNHSNPNY